MPLYFLHRFVVMWRKASGSHVCQTHNSSINISCIQATYHQSSLVWIPQDRVLELVIIIF